MVIRPQRISLILFGIAVLLAVAYYIVIESINKEVAQSSERRSDYTSENEVYRGDEENANEVYRSNEENANEVYRNDTMEEGEHFIVKDPALKNKIFIYSIVLWLLTMLAEMLMAAVILVPIIRLVLRHIKEKQAEDERTNNDENLR